MLQFFKDGDGQLSSMRLVMLGWSYGMLAVWMYTSIVAGEMLPLDGTALGMMGAVMAGKVGQSYTERD